MLSVLGLHPFVAQQSNPVWPDYCLPHPVSLSSSLTALQPQCSLSVPGMLWVLCYHRAFTLTLSYAWTTFHIAYLFSSFSFQLKHHFLKEDSKALPGSHSLPLLQTSSQSETLLFVYLAPPTSPEMSFSNASPGLRTVPSTGGSW